MTAASSADSSRFSFRRPKKKKAQAEHGQTPAAAASNNGSFTKPRPSGSRPSVAPPSSSSRRNRSYSPTQKKKPSSSSSSKSRPTVNRANSQIMMVSRDYSIEAATEEFRQAGLRRKTAGQPSLRMAASERLRLREILMARERGDDSGSDEADRSPRFDVADSSIYRGEAVLRFRELLNEDHGGDLDASEKPQGGRSGRRRGRRPSRRRSMSFDDKDAAAFLLSGLKVGDGRAENDSTGPANNDRPDDNNSSYSSGQFKDSLKSSGKLFDEKIRLALEKKERKKAEKKSSRRERRKGSLLSKDKSRRGRDDSAVDRGKVQRSRRRSMSCDDKEVAAFLKLKEDRQNRSSENSCPSSVEGHNMSSNSLVEDSSHTQGSDRSRKHSKSNKRERRKSGLVKGTSRRRSAERGTAARSRRRSMSCDDKEVAAYLRGRGGLSNNSSVEEEEEETRAVTRRPFEPPTRTVSAEYDREIMLERQSEERQRIERERNSAEQAERVAQRRFERWKRRSQMGMQQQSPVADDGGGDGDSSGCETMRRSLSDPDVAMSSSRSAMGDSTLTQDVSDDHKDVPGDTFGEDGPPPVHRPYRPGPVPFINRRGTIDQHALVNFVRSPGLDDSVIDDDRPMSRLYDQIMPSMPRDSLAPNGATSAQYPGGGGDDHASVLKFSTTSVLHDSTTQHSDDYSQRFSMDEYIQLKMSVAELRSELQEAQNLASRYQNKLKEVEVDMKAIEKKNKMLMGIVVGAVKEGKLSVSVLKGLKD